MEALVFIQVMDLFKTKVHSLDIMDSEKEKLIEMGTSGDIELINLAFEIINTYAYRDS